MSEADEIFAVLERVPLFEGLRRATIQNLAATAQMKALKKGKDLFRQGFTANGCHVVLTGVLKVSVRDDSKPHQNAAQNTLALLGRGDLIGEMSLVDNRPRSATVTALSDSVLAHLTDQAFFKLADADTDIYRRFLKLLSERLRATNERVKETQRPLSNRLALVMLRLADAFGEPLPDGRTLIRHRMSQSEMGRLAGAARENINRQLREWETAGELAKISGYYCLKDKLYWQQTATEHPSDQDEDML